MLKKLITSLKIKFNSKPVEDYTTASRHFSNDLRKALDILPDPDPVLQKTGTGINALRQLSRDPHVRAMIQQRKSGTKKLELKIERGDASENITQDVEDLFDLLPMHKIISQILNAPLYGYQPLEVSWKCIKKHWIPVKVSAKPPEWFCFDNEGTLKLITKNNRKGEELPPYSMLLAQHEADDENPHGIRLLSSCFWPYVFKNGGFKFWVTFTEKFGMPYIIGKVPPNYDQTKTNKLADMLVDMVQDAIAVIPNDASVEFKEAAGKSGSAEIYEKLINICNAEISKAILGQTLSSENTGTGSYAATAGHLEIRDDIVDDDKKMVEKVLNTLIEWYCNLNYPSQEIPKAKLYEEEKIDKTRAERDEIIVRTGVKLLKPYFERYYNLDEDEFEVISSEEVKKEPSEFAEKEDLQTNQQALDDFIDSISSEEFQAQVEPLITPVIDLIQQSKSYEEILEGIAKKYPDQDDQYFAEKLAKSLFVAEFMGGLDANRG